MSLSSLYGFFKLKTVDKFNRRKMLRQGHDLKYEDPATIAKRPTENLYEALLLVILQLLEITSFQAEKMPWDLTERKPIVELHSF